jgi:hypothetical protein
MLSIFSHVLRIPSVVYVMSDHLIWAIDEVHEVIFDCPQQRKVSNDHGHAAQRG